MDTLSTSLQGIAAGFDRLDRAARAVARNGADGDLPTQLVEMMKARHEVRANVAAARTADEMVGSLLDVIG